MVTEIEWVLSTFTIYLNYFSPLFFLFDKRVKKILITDVCIDIWSKMENAQPYNSSSSDTTPVFFTLFLIF